MNTLKQIDKIVRYPCAFYGLKSSDKENKIFLAQNIYFIKNYVSSVIYPDTKVSTLSSFFKTNENISHILNTIQRSDDLKIIDWLTNTAPFIISTKWSVLKLIKSILYVCHKPMYLSEVKWILDDLKIPNEKFIENKYKIYDDKQIIRENNTIEYFDYSIKNSSKNEMIDIFYELLLETGITFSFNDFMSEFSSDLTIEGLNEEKLRALLEEDERFIVTDELILVKS